MSKIDIGSCVISFATGGIIVLLFFIGLTVPSSRDTISFCSSREACIITCEPNGGLETHQLDGDCICRNGAEFEEEDYLKL